MISTTAARPLAQRRAPLNCVAGERARRLAGDDTRASGQDAAVGGDQRLHDRRARPSQRNHVRAVSLIAVEGKGVDKVMRRMHGFPEVRRLHSTNGRWDIVAELVTDTLAAFDGLLNRIRAGRWSCAAAAPRGSR